MNVQVVFFNGSRECVVKFQLSDDFSFCDCVDYIFQCEDFDRYFENGYCVKSVTLI